MACLPRGLYVLFALISLFIFNDLLSKAISGSTRPIFTKFSPYGKYLIVDYRVGADRLFSIAHGTLPWQPILGSKWAKSADSPSLVALAFLNRVEYCNFDFKRLNINDLATSYKNMVNFGRVTPEFKRGKDVHPSSISSLATSAWWRH